MSDDRSKNDNDPGQTHGGPEEAASGSEQAEQLNSPEESSEEERKAAEAFNDAFDEDRAEEHPEGHEDFDEYEDDPYDDYDDYSDYGMDENDAGAEPKSVAHRVLTRNRNEPDAGAVDSDEDEPDGMSFLEHLEEFRWTVARSVLAFVIGVIVVVIFHKQIAVFMQMPLHKAYGSAEVARENLITYKAMGVISVFFQVALLGGFTLSMPFALYFMGRFVAPGLNEKERKVLGPSCFAAFVLFLVGVAFAFYIILPLALAFTVKLNQHMGFDIFWAASDYYNMVVWFSLSIGAFFQFPLIVVLLVFIGVLATETLKGARRLVFVALMVFSALVSPGGDPISLSVTTGFMYGLYELAIAIGGRIERKRQAEIDAALE